MSLSIRSLVDVCFCVAAVGAGGCADGSVNPVSPTASPAVSRMAATGNVSGTTARSDDSQGPIARSAAVEGMSGSAAESGKMLRLSIDSLTLGSRHLR